MIGGRLHISTGFCSENCVTKSSPVWRRRGVGASDSADSSRIVRMRTRVRTHPRFGVDCLNFRPRRPTNAMAAPRRSLMAEAAVDAKWKDRYRDLVRDLEDKERHWTSLEGALRAAAGKLALAAMGQGKALDAALEKVIAALRSDISPPQLDASVSQLVRALQIDET